MNKATIVLRTNYVKKDGSYPVYLKVIISAKEKIYSLHVSVLDTNWNDKKKEVLKSDPFYYKKNLLLHKSFKKATDILYNSALHEKNITHKEFENEMFSGSHTDKTSYFTFAENEIKLKSGICSPGHLIQHKYELTKLKRFKPQIFIEDINYTFLQEYESYMRNTLNNRTNTVGKTFQKMKALLHIAIKKDIIPVSPFLHYKLKKEKTQRVFLSPPELRQLENLYKTESGTIKTVLQYFLFAVFTGLRYSDIAALTWQNINNDMLTLRMTKTNVPLQLPLTEPAKKMLPENTGLFVFKTLSNQKSNDYLKLIAAKAGINKSLSFHSARHTFATISLSLGIPITTIKELLGHEEINTTMIYAKIMDEQKLKDIQKWNVFNK